jgi:DNA-binding NarL/FixJ family response regulator
LHGRVKKTDIHCRLVESGFISPRTVEKHPYKIYQKEGTKNRLQLFNLLRSDAL